MAEVVRHEADVAFGSMAMKTKRTPIRQLDGAQRGLVSSALTSFVLNAFEVSDTSSTKASLILKTKSYIFDFMYPAYDILLTENTAANTRIQINGRVFRPTRPRGRKIKCVEVVRLGIVK